MKNQIDWSEEDFTDRPDLAEAWETAKAEKMAERLSATAAVMGKKGGASTSSAKAKASRENGRKGGRPATILKYVLSNRYSGAWLQMFDSLKDIPTPYPNCDYRIELWTYRRMKNEDEIVNKEPLCDCVVFGKPGQIYNSGVWMTCPDCGYRSNLYVSASGHETMINKNGRCEDAPCCGCCD